MGIVCIIATCELNTPIDLNELAEKIKEFNYSPDLFAPCGYLKDVNLKGNARIWKSGTIHLVGKSEEAIKEDLRYILNKLRDKMGLNINDL